MPTPRRNEDKKEFMARCIPEVIGEGYGNDQAVAICERYWEDGKQLAVVEKIKTPKPCTSGKTRL